MFTNKLSLQNLKPHKISLISIGIAQWILLAGSLFAPPKAQASPLEFEFQADIPAEEYQRLVQPVLTPMRYLFVHPAAPSGTVGFDIGIAATGAALPPEVKGVAEQYIEDGSDFPSFIAIPRLTAQKGLPFGIDLGVNLAAIPGSDIMLAGGALQWAFVDGPFPIPSLAFRVGHTQLLGLDALKAQITNFEGVASWGIPPGVSLLKPYFGAGAAWAAAESEFQVTDVAQGLDTKLQPSASWQEIYGLAGLQLSLFPFISITAEIQASEEQQFYSAKLSAGL